MKPMFTFFSTAAADCAGATAGRRRAAEQSCLALLNACKSLPDLLQVQSHLLKLGLHSNPFVLTKFTQSAAPLDAAAAAADLAFSNPPSALASLDAFFYNALIRAHASAGDDAGAGGAVWAFSAMRAAGVSPNKFTFPFLLKAAAFTLDLRLVKLLHGLVLKLDFHGDLFVQNTLIHAYCCGGGGGFRSARAVFDAMPKSSPVTWSAMIGGCARNAESRDAVSLFREMQVAGVRPDEVTIVSVLSACADLGALETGRWIEKYVDMNDDVPRTLTLSNAMIDMFAKCGGIDDALRVFDGMSVRSIVTWTSMIDGLAVHGRGSEAVALFEEMKRSGVAPDDVAFIGVLSACSHAGLVELGCGYFDSMRVEFGIAPKIEHYGCMVDLFSRAGLVERAMEFIQGMPMDANPIIWRTLVRGCRAHGKLQLGETITKRLLGDEPMHGSNYVLLSNIYASMRRWKEKNVVRKTMGGKGIRKIPGCSLVELGDEIHEFVAGDRSSPQYREIYEMLDEMGKEMKKAGYAPTTSEVLLDIDEEDKEDALNRHSEKLAIAFALLNTMPGTPVRIVKNLRVCRDCHTATKFISKAYGREIIVRDRSRFHLFQDGECSCKDYW